MGVRISLFVLRKVNLGVRILLFVLRKVHLGVRILQFGLRKVTDFGCLKKKVFVCLFVSCCFVFCFAFCFVFVLLSRSSNSMKGIGTVDDSVSHALKMSEISPTRVSEQAHYYRKLNHRFVFFVCLTPFKRANGSHALGLFPMI